MSRSFAALLVVLSLGPAAASACSSDDAPLGASAAGTGTGTGGGGGQVATVSATTTTSTTTGMIADAGPGVDDGMVSTVYPAPHPAAPQIVSAGGPVLTTPTLIPVFFSNDDAATVSDLVAYLGQLGDSSYLAAATAEYGITAPAVLPPVMLSEAASGQLTDNGIQTWLAGKLNANDPAWPQPATGALYLLHYPKGTAITQQGSVSCQNFGAYHSGTSLDSAHGFARVAYAVMPRCDSFYPVVASGTEQIHFTGLDGVTAAESHEIVEAFTDPYPFQAAAFIEPDRDHLYWAVVAGGGEAGDLCEPYPAAFVKLASLPYEVQRTWSNAAAKAGKDPCVPPFPGEVYFNSAPVLPDSIVVPQLGKIKGVKVPVGTTATIEIDLFSEADTGGPWTVSVQDLSNTMDLSLDRTTGQNGEKLHLTITVNDKAPAEYAVFQILSTRGLTNTVWYGAVGYK